MQTKYMGMQFLEQKNVFKASLDFGDGIITEKFKTFFPTSWSREKVTQVIFEAAQNKIREITSILSPHKTFLCQSKNNLLIEIVINKENTIISAYPSGDNFLGILL